METELKFQVPPASRAAVRAAVATASARHVRLQARYFDTAGARLAEAGLALRLRNEGGGWVQTLKGRGDGLVQRLEHEVPLAATRGTPALDVTRHEGTAAADALRRALAGEAAVVQVFATDIQRTLRRVRSGGATIEIALDVGWLQAGRRRQAVHEVEFELIAGPPRALPLLAARWVQRFGLWWDVRTKAERGQRLARAVEAVPAVGATRPLLARTDAPGTAFARMVEAALAQALPNLAEIADGRGAAEHLHQARVALRRLRAVMRECAAWSGDEAGARALEDAWREPFARLGAARDRDVLIEQVLPRLQALGLPVDASWTKAAVAAAPPAAGGAKPHDLPAAVTGAEVQGLLLRSLVAAQAARAQRTDAGPSSLRRAAKAVLQRCWKRTLAGTAHFHRLPTVQQHRVRKRLKRLRYLFDFLRPLYPGRAATRLQKILGQAADLLGELNDLAVAAATFGPQWPPQALVALEAHRRHIARRAERQLLALRRAPRPWRD